MGVPQRFATEYPSRCLDLIQILDGQARERDLIGSFALLVAGSILTMPFERLNPRHFLFQDQDQKLSLAIKGLDKVKFSRAPFWRAEAVGTWRQSRIMANVKSSHDWIDEDGHHPMSQDARNRIDDYSASEVLRVVRNALAHGNVIYLGKNGLEVPGERTHFLAFLSRYEERPVDNPTFRIVATPEADFLNFIKDWAVWVGRMEG